MYSGCICRLDVFRVVEKKAEKSFMHCFQEKYGNGASVQK